MLQVKTSAIVLDKQPGYNDEGNVTVFTRSFGILRLTASGVYRSGASLAAWTEPPASVVADITVQKNSFGYGRLLTLSLKNYFPYIRSSCQKLGWFYFYCFLLQNFLPPGIKSEKTYRLLKDVLEFQDSWENDKKIDLNFTYFLVRLLKIEGICSGFRHCVACEKILGEEETTYYSLSEQGLLCENCSRGAVSTKRQPNNLSLDFLKLLPQERTLKLPEGLLRIKPEEKIVLETCEKSKQIAQAYTNIFSRPKINDQTLAKARNFLLIFLAPLL